MNEAINGALTENPAKRERSAIYLEAKASIAANDSAAHPAARAWAKLCSHSSPGGCVPTAITPLKEQRQPLAKSGVWRLVGASNDGANVIAKRCLKETAWVERTIYEQILPHCTISALDYFGYLEEDGSAFSWLFIGDGSDDKPTPLDRGLASAWLARLHTSAAKFAGKVPLPSRGAAHYLEHLTASRALLDHGLTHVASTDELRQLLLTLLSEMEQIQSWWPVLSAFCDKAPVTLVHGDFSRKNVRAGQLRGSGERCIYALDWETAGWGPIAADLAQWPRRSAAFGIAGSDPTDQPRIAACALDAYVEAMQAQGVKACRAEVDRLACVGTVFRLVAGVRWAAEQLKHGSYKAPTRLAECEAHLPPAIAKLECVR